MTVDTGKLPILKLGSAGKSVTWAKQGVNAWKGQGSNTTPLYGPFFITKVMEFKFGTGCGDRGKTGVVGKLTWDELIKYLPPEVRRQMPQKMVMPNLGPVYSGGGSILHERLTHATAGIPLYPAFDTAFRAGIAVIAPEELVIHKKYSSSNPGLAFYAQGKSGLDYWFGHLDRRHTLGTRFAKGQFLGRTVATVRGGGPHLHLGVNVERIMGSNAELAYKFPQGAASIGAQLLAFYSHG